MNTPRRIGLMLVLAVAAGACSTPEQRAQRQQVDMQQRMVIHGPECVGLGFARDTDPWRECVIEQGALAELDALSAYHAGWRHGMW